MTVALQGIDLEIRLAELSDKLDRLLFEAEQRQARMRMLEELVSDLGPVLKEASGSATTWLEAIDARRYVSFGKAGLGVIDRVVGSFAEEDVEALGENIVLILETVKEMTQPEVMQMLRRSLDTARGEPEEAPSLIAIARELRDPQVRRGLARVLRMLRSAGEPTGRDSIEEKGGER